MTKESDLQAAIHQMLALNSMLSKNRFARPQFNNQVQSYKFLKSLSSECNMVVSAMGLGESLKATLKRVKTTSSKESDCEKAELVAVELGRIIATADC